MFFRMVYKSGQIFLPFCHNTRVWQTDGQTDRRTDGRTDGRTEFLSQYRVCITCSAVKTRLIMSLNSVKKHACLLASVSFSSRSKMLLRLNMFTFMIYSTYRSNYDTNCTMFHLSLTSSFQARGLRNFHIQKVRNPLSRSNVIMPRPHISELV